MFPPTDANPFATRFTRPDVAEYLFGEDVSAESLVVKLAANNWWGQIIGPHGSGKSTLLTALSHSLTAAGRNVVRFSLSEGKRSLPAADTAVWTAATQVIVDGYEQLWWWNRRRLQARCRRAGAGLLVTAHTPVGLPDIFQTSPSLAMAERVVERLLPPGDQHLTPADISSAFESQRGNLREALFQLYDLYELRRRS